MTIRPRIDDITSRFYAKLSGIVLIVLTKEVPTRETKMQLFLHRSYLFIIYLLLFTQNSLFSSVDLLLMWVLPSLRNTRSLAKLAVIRNFHHQRPHSGMELGILRHQTQCPYRSATDPHDYRKIPNTVVECIITSKVLDNN